LKRTAYPSILLATLILAACGGGDSSGSPEADSTSTQASAPETAPQANADAEVDGETPPEFAQDQTPEPPKQSAPDIDESDPSETSDAPSVGVVTEPEPQPEAETEQPSTAASTAVYYHLYVATNGSDSNPGTKTRPFKTILKASKVAKPGTVVHVAPGTYAGGFQTSASGTATARISYVSDTKWGAKIVQYSTTTATAGWRNSGRYTDIVGFDIDGQNGKKWTTGLGATGSYTVLKNNRVRNIATTVACTSMGASAINTHNYYNGYYIDVIGNVVHNIGYDGCGYFQGIYVSTSGKVLNNLVYKVGAYGIHLWHDARNITIANNTSTDNGIGMVVGSGGHYKEVLPANNVHVSNNIVYGNKRLGITEQGLVGSNNTYTNNLVYSNGINWRLKNKTHSGTVSANPQFVSPSTGDYRLKSTSPAIGYGSSRYAPSDDIVGAARPQGGRDDIGAYEYIGSAAR
jgi:hypothetical protein